MPTAEEVLIRLRAIAENGLSEIDEATDQLRELKSEAAEIDLGLETGDLNDALDELEQRLGTTRTALGDLGASAEQTQFKVQPLGDGLRDAAGQMQAAAASGRNLTATATGLAGGLAAGAAAALVLQQELEALDEIQAKIATGVELLRERYPEVADAVEDGARTIEAAVGGPLTKLNFILDEAARSWREFIEEIETSTATLDPALQRLVDQGEDAASQFARLRDEIVSSERDLRVAEQNLVRVADSLERTGEATDPIRIKILELAQSLREDLQEAGIEVSDELDALIAKYAEFGEQAEASSEQAIEAARRQAEETRAARLEQAEAFEEAADREIEAAERVLEREGELLERRLEQLEEFREGFGETQEALEQFQQTLSEEPATDGLSSTREELEAVQTRIEELNDASVLTVEQLNEQITLRERESDLLAQVADEEVAAANAALDSGDQIIAQKEAVGEVIEAARDRLEEFRSKFGELAPAAVAEIEAIIGQLELQAEQTRVNGDEVESLGIRLESAFERGTRRAEEQLRVLEQQVESFRQSGDAAETLAERLEAAFGAGIPLSREQLEILQQQAAALERQKDEAGAIADALGRTRETFEGFAEQVETEIGPATEVLEAAAEQTVAFADGAERGAAAITTIAETSDALVEGLEQQTAAVDEAAPTLERYAETLDQSAAAVERIAEQTLVAAENQEALADASETTAATLDRASDRVKSFGQDLERVADQSRATADAVVQFGQRAEEAAARAQQALSQVLSILREIEAQAAATAAAIDQIGAPGV